jgi:arsenate reductase (thioredoxin)
MDEFKGALFELVVTVCDESAQNCPVWLGKGTKIHLGFPDPAEAKGSEDEKLVVFRGIRDDMLSKIIVLMDNQIQL